MDTSYLCPDCKKTWEKDGNCPECGTKLQAIKLKQLVKERFTNGMKIDPTRDVER